MADGTYEASRAAVSGLPTAEQVIGAPPTSRSSAKSPSMTLAAPSPTRTSSWTEPTEVLDTDEHIPARRAAAQAPRDRVEPYLFRPPGAPSDSALSWNFASNEAATMPTATTAITIVQTALISGFTPRRISE